MCPTAIGSAPFASNVLLSFDCAQLLANLTGSWPLRQQTTKSAHAHVRVHTRFETGKNKLPIE
jgi:hypothetical protein